MLKVTEPRCEYSINPIGLGTAKPRVSWKIVSDKKGVIQLEYHLQVSLLEDFGQILWDTGDIMSDRSVHIEYDGPELLSRTRYYYRIRIKDNKGESSDWSQTSFWETGLFGRSEWKAQWITSGQESSKSGEPCPFLRKTFTVEKKIKAARIYATSLGLYELYINGRRVGDELFAPGWTSYNKRLQYQTYDVTDMLTTGTNAAGAILGDGWYRGQLTWDMIKNNFGDKLALLFQLHIIYNDGSEQIIASDKDWKSSTGPILMSDIYDGEIYDARLGVEEWSQPDFNDGSWNNAEVINHSYDELIAQEGLPVRRINEIKPVSLFTTPMGETVLDMGQNMVGWIKFKLEGRAGSEIVLQHTEVLDKDGNFYIDNLRNAKQIDRYIFKGIGVETFEPHFTFHGFRYVKIEGYEGKLSPEAFTGIVIHSDMEPAGSFECSDSLLNQLQHNIIWGQKSNFVDVPTDCPQRDERLGWTGDAQVFIKAACFNMNTALFFTKWLNDVRADQYESGGIPSVIPDVMPDSRESSSAWGDAAAICPWTIYLFYDDERLLARQYGSMKAWVEYIRHQGENEYLWNTGFHYGDWLGLDAKEGSYTGATDKELIATAFYAWSTSILAKTAAILGKEDDAKEYSELLLKIKDNFRSEFVTPNGKLAVPTQTAHVLALMFDLMEDRHIERTIETLGRYISDNGDHLSTGFVGTPYICHVLSRYGRNDLAWKLVQQKEFPSWLYPVTKGATTMWEHWDGIKPDGTFWSRDMNSFNHYAYGAIGDWLFGTAAGIGITCETPGFKHITIAPRPGGGLTFVRASYKSLYGDIKSAWSVDGGKITYEIEIPHNTAAAIILPSEGKLVYENDTKIENVGEISNIKVEAGTTSFEVGSGKYCFSYEL